MQIVRGVRRQGLPKIIAAEGTNFNNLTRKSVAVSAPLKRTLHFFFETVRFRHDSVQDASHFPVLQFDSKQILRLIVYNENIEQILPGEKIFRDLFSNYGKEFSIGKKLRVSHTKYKICLSFLCALVIQVHRGSRGRQKLVF